MEKFDDVIAGNRAFVASYHETGLTGRAAKGLALITCMDSRIDPLAVLGMQAGDMKILRNAGARVTDDVLRTLVLATHLLNVDRIIVMPHTDCRMAKNTEAEVHESILDVHGVDTRSLEFRTIDDPIATLRADVQKIRSFPFIPEDVVVVGGMYDVATGELEMYDF
ncbi:MAG: carbonic anhydrase [Actinobacteria bacterium]|nr:carbonic anhydrase [Actinomycetota bacterium]MCB8996207.1 carbonic anhydrase [Actinomycetota bacterium]MCB9413914.1 carbonic anhydrase [Actinomycetota bacterium]HRY09598.1 carbonic anhydrase [Candidatus Nanopelagicales bacterium]